MYKDREWLYQKYITEQLSTYQIARLVNRDPKTIWSWLKKLEIPTRERLWDNFIQEEDILYHDKEWLEFEYIELGRSASDIACQFGVVSQNIYYFLHKFGIPTRTISEARDLQYWGLSGASNGMYGKRGAEVPSWRGGATPERQAFYQTEQWKETIKLIYQRDKGLCQRCGSKPSGRTHHIHHIVSFVVEELRTELDNLVLLCHPCHCWVHSNQNTSREYIRDGKGVQ